MKRIMTVLLLLALLAGACASAESHAIMVVVNCEEWVSLRAAPSTSAARLAKVPKGGVVFDCSSASKGFFQCTYEGQTGYILAQYLEAAEEDPESNEPEPPVMDVKVNGLRVLAERSWLSDGEALRVACTDDSGAQRWVYETETGSITELNQTDAFLGGTAEDPLVMVYNTEKGLAALELTTGEARWTLTDEHLGASISHAVAADGTVYIGGYYGPDPVAIGPDGAVEWRSNSGGCYWLYQMAIEEGILACKYDVIDDEHSGTVLFALDGDMIDKFAD